MVLTEKITRGSPEGRVLLALRGGPHERHELDGRFGTSVTASLFSLSKRGLVESGDGTWRITAAGRAACPFRNPLLSGEAPCPTGQASQPEDPEEETMNDLQGTTYKSVVSAIVSAGPAGLTRKQLAEQFGAGTRKETTRLDAHVSYALRQSPPAIAKLAPGHYVGAVYMPVKPGEEAPKAVAKAKPRVKAEKYPAPVFAEAAAAPAPSPAPSGQEPQTPQEPQALLPGFYGRLRIDDPGLLEFAVFSTGSFELHTEFGVISMSQAAMRKLRAFLGLFADAS